MLQPRLQLSLPEPFLKDNFRSFSNEAIHRGGDVIRRRSIYNFAHIWSIIKWINEIIMVDVVHQTLEFKQIFFSYKHAACRSSPQW